MHEPVPPAHWITVPAEYPCDGDAVVAVPVPQANQTVCVAVGGIWIERYRAPVTLNAVLVLAQVTVEDVTRLAAGGNEPGTCACDAENVAPMARNRHVAAMRRLRERPLETQQDWQRFFRDRKRANHAISNGQFFGFIGFWCFLMLMGYLNGRWHF